ncbi:MAG: ATP-binding cassette domain-containing protein [Variovorax sp.]
MNESAPALQVDGMVKNYGAVKALRGVDLALRSGEVLALCGDNGAGKSSLVRVLSGAHEASAGRIALFGKAVTFTSPHDALAQGIATIYQDLAIAPELNIWQNVFMGAELTRSLLPGLRILDKRAMRSRAAELLQGLNQTIPDIDCSVSQLSGGQRQAVAISRALLWQARVVIMDEPTAALGVKETAEVLTLVRRLRESGAAVLLVSHSMEDVVSVADRVVVLKAGRKAAESTISGLTPALLAQAIMSGAF